MSTKKTKSEIESQLKSLDGQIKDSKADISVKQQHVATMEAEAKKLRKTLSEYNIPTEIKISDHALMRYCERALGINFEDIKSAMVTDELKGYIKALGTTGTYPLGKLQVVVKDNTIVTILD